jgi:hypothetical protein
MLGSDAEACYAQVGLGACLTKVQLEQQLPKPYRDPGRSGVRNKQAAGDLRDTTVTLVRFVKHSLCRETGVG